MFDPSYRVSINANVTEKRAPTDESVRLLREMEDAARDKIIKSIRLDDNRFKGVIILEQDYLNMQTIMAVHYTLNGEKRTAKTYMKNGGDRQTAIDALVCDLALDISRNILQQAFLESEGGKMLWATIR